MQPWGFMSQVYLKIPLPQNFAAGALLTGTPGSFYKGQMSKLPIAAVVLSLLLLPSLAPACPLGPGEAGLTLKRVMRNFGRYIFPADEAVRKGIAAPASVTEHELSNACDSLVIAISCAEAVLADRSGSLDPRKSRELTGEARELYLKVFLQRMNEFLRELAAYRAIHAALLESAAAERDFLAAMDKMRAVNEAARRAHEDTQ